jgi:hypothetical protein
MEAENISKPVYSSGYSSVKRQRFNQIKDDLL